MPSEAGDDASVGLAEPLLEEKDPVGGWEADEGG
jgi:hypothetical protein